jgi:hypothetical protein
MKRIIFPILAISFFVACENSPKAEAPKEETKVEATAKAPQFFGEKITEEGAMPTDSLKSMMGDKTELACKLVGKVDAVCQKKGCWMELKNADGSAMRVTFKDYAFFMPKDGAGLTAIVDGMAKVEVTSVADLKEYAKDDGKSAEDIAKITEPLKELVFEAKGVILK